MNYRKNVNQTTLSRLHYGFRSRQRLPPQRSRSGVLNHSHLYQPQVLLVGGQEADKNRGLPQAYLASSHPCRLCESESFVGITVDGLARIWDESKLLYHVQLLYAESYTCVAVSGKRSI